MGEVRLPFVVKLSGKEEKRHEDVMNIKTIKDTAVSITAIVRGIKELVGIHATSILAAQSALELLAPWVKMSLWLINLISH